MTDEGMLVLTFVGTDDVDRPRQFINFVLTPA